VAALERARSLDEALDAFMVEGPSAALHQRILARAPQPRAAWRPWRAGGVLWLSGAGLAAACAAGVLLGVSLGASISSTDRLSDRDSEVSAAFGAVTAFGSPVDADTKG
jgi:hypothetical protein